MPPLWVQFRLETRARRPTCPIARIAPAAVLVSIQLKLLCLITTLVFAALGATAIMVTSPIGISTKAAAVGFVDQATAKAAGAVPRSVASIFSVSTAAKPVSGVIPKAASAPPLPLAFSMVFNAVEAQNRLNASSEIMCLCDKHPTWRRSSARRATTLTLTSRSDRLHLGDVTGNYTVPPSWNADVLRGFWSMGRSDAITLLATEAGRQLVPASSQALLEAILTCDDLSLSLSCGLPSVAEPQVARSQRLFPDEADYFADVRQQAHSDNAVPPSLPATRRR